MKKNKDKTIKVSEPICRLFSQANDMKLNADLYLHHFRELNVEAFNKFLAENPSVDKEAKLSYLNGVMTIGCKAA